MPAFELSKWYADCVTAEGDAAIVYHAELRWLAITVHYSSLLIHGAGSPTRVLYSLRKRPAPVLQGDQISWQSPDWLVAGTWQDLGPSYSNLLFQSESGSLEWNCIAPRASAVIRVGSEPTLRSLGNRPARTSEVLPVPEVPNTTVRTLRRTSQRSWSISASRPKKNWRSSSA